MFDYRPQHQSACGLNFIEPADDGSLFGPSWWQSDALVTGYSRGKLYRTKLVKTAGGYVGQNQLLASLSMLAADACVAPGRSIVIATHSGGPDWGSGPSGKGKLFKVTYAATDAPLPALVWAAGPQEVRIAFDRAIDPDSLKGLASRIAMVLSQLSSSPAIAIPSPATSTTFNGTTRVIGTLSVWAIASIC